MKRFLLATALGIALTAVCMQAELSRRGYFALGGEIFLLPAVYLSVYAVPAFARSIGELLQEIKEESDEIKPEEVSGNQKDGSCPNGRVPKKCTG